MTVTIRTAEHKVIIRQKGFAEVKFEAVVTSMGRVENGRAVARGFIEVPQDIDIHVGDHVLVIKR